MSDDNIGVSSLSVENYNNVVSLENYEDINEGYLLKAPRKGKLHKGPIWTAYKRENLGSIPRRTENVLVDDKDSKTKKGFSSTSERFFQRPQTVKYAYPGPGSYSTTKGFEFSTTESSFHSSKGFGNGFVSAAERFDDPKEYYSKYYPGPGQYKADETLSMTSCINKSLHYKSLYDKGNIKSLKVKKDTPGPGHYNPILMQNEKPLADSNFKSVVERFTKLHQGQVPGPGKYFKDDLMRPNTMQTTKASYFFKPEQEKNVDLLEKHLGVEKIKHYKVPGPGTYNLRKNLGRDYSADNTVNYIYNFNHSNIRRKSVAEVKPKRLPNISSYESDINKAEIKNDKLSHIFLSKSPRSILAKSKHVPGPAYYSPVKTDKTSHNYNNDKKWI